MLPELFYYFTVARWIEEVKASSSRTCVERGGAVRSARDRKDRDHDRDTGRDLITERTMIDRGTDRDRIVRPFVI